MNETFLSLVKFNAEGLIPAVIQKVGSGEVLMVAHMNRESLKQTLETGETVFYSRSRKSLWKKGESSGSIQKVREILIDCDEDTLLFKVEQIKGACHTGRLSCFYRKWDRLQLVEMDDRSSSSGLVPKQILERISETISKRRENPSSGSYVSALLVKGEDAILKKVAEEAAEVLLSSKGKVREEIVWEVADLWFHTLVLLGFHGLPLQEVFRELEKREGKPGLKG
ncbi:MAG: bifunctional phosphoribosyl-AMP cyclohydrolase/phosphoribosyl-ATP diphosphatase HisIE [Nitrospirae bacterium]|nr:bifunctional phosphoribosyl-AMP cyclohydrolase/phosphoribosyl-ATP diphosphatase HisIE [Nitrospirota bacterium]MBI3593879.1 bifunctional phosphoribosyl-AMP cyclohydrolase/phosphoribosyl-ATP diphosphatase HisIE [Nitrospirota bacterium]